jgi:hypothetical protein
LKLAQKESQNRTLFFFAIFDVIYSLSIMVVYCKNDDLKEIYGFTIYGLIFDGEDFKVKLYSYKNVYTYTLINCVE